MKERPILFTGQMVRAILDGRKTETRRIVKPEPAYPNAFDCLRREQSDVNQRVYIFQPNAQMASDYWKMPFVKGDLLWVKETHFVEITGDFTYDVEGLKLSQWAPELIKEAIIHYRATTELKNPDDWRWCASIHMPRWASRITLQVVSVHAERLQDITDEGAIAEGMDPEGSCRQDQYTDGSYARSYTELSPRDLYAELWDRINGEGSWALNPWVWVIKFERIDLPTKAVEQPTKEVCSE